MRGGDVCNSSRFRLIVVYDVDGWAYHRRAEALARYAPADFAVDILPIRDLGAAAWPWARFQSYDLCFLIEYAAASQFRQSFRDCGISTPLVVSHNADRHRRRSLWETVCRSADFVIANNMCVWEHHGRRPRTCCISNGVDREIFCPGPPIAQRLHRIFWRGSGNEKKSKGWRSILEPSIPRLEALGFEPDFAAITSIQRQRLDTPELVERYRQSSYVVCTSLSEGTPNYVLEAVSCGAVAVSTHVGNVREWGRHGHNCVLIPRTADGLIAGLLHARRHREALSESALDTIATWHYGGPHGRAQWFFQLFRRIITGGPGSIRPFSYAQTHWSRI